MKTKIFLLFITLQLTSNIWAQSNATKIDFDYSKVFFINYLVIDKNQNGDFEEDEMYECDTRSNFFIEYKDFGNAGNRVKIKLDLKNGKANRKYIGNMEDVDFGRFTKDGSTHYFADDKLGDRLFSVTTNNKKENIVVIWNIAILRELIQ